MSKILIVCGGTGGHLAPGIALTEVLQERGHECQLLISHKEVDSALTRKYGDFTFVKMPGRAFVGGARARLLSLFSMASAALFSRRILRREKPQLVILFGGFLSVGFGLAARLSGIQVALHEANCRPGRAVRLNKYVADRVYLPEGLQLKGVRRGKVRHLGYPVRREIKHVLKAVAWKRLGITVSNKLLVVIGGSQGAVALNNWVIKSFPDLAAHGITVYCVTGLGKSASGTLQGMDAKGEPITATFVPFTENMGDVISAADLVVSRAGAGAIAEIIRCRAPAILVPYPFATDDHQQANARAHEQHGAGMVLEESRIDGLMDEVKSLIFNDWMLSRFKSNLVRLDRFDAAEAISTDLEDLLVEAEARNIDSRKAEV